MPTHRIVPHEHVLPPPEPLRVAMGDADMERLEESIKQVGVMYPLLVLPRYRTAAGELGKVPIKRRHKGPEDADCYEIVDGHRRWVACERLHIGMVPVLVLENADQASLQMMLDANVCREDVTPFEEGFQFLELAEKHQWSMDQLRATFGKSEDYINDRVDIVRKDGNVAAAVRDRRINLGQAKECLRCQDPTWRLALLEQAAVHGATVGALREMRHQYDREAAQAQGVLPMNTPAHAEPAAIIPPEVCAWCGKDHDPFNLVVIKVHQYELQDLKAVLDRFSARALVEQFRGRTGEGA